MAQLQEEIDEKDAKVGGGGVCSYARVLDAVDRGVE